MSLKSLFNGQRGWTEEGVCEGGGIQTSEKNRKLRFYKEASENKRSQNNDHRRGKSEGSDGGGWRVCGFVHSFLWLAETKSLGNAWCSHRENILFTFFFILSH